MIHRLIESLLSGPHAFNRIRSLIAGDQHNTKSFVRETLLQYHVSSVLDVGCGTGDFVQCVTPTMKYTGADLNKKYIDYARSTYGTRNKTWNVQDVTEKSFYQKSQYDAVLLISMLHHLSDKELDVILPVIKKMTNKIVVVADIIPNPPGFLRKLMVRLDQGRYIRPPEEKRKILNKYFKIVRTVMIPSRLAIQYGIVCR